MAVREIVRNARKNDGVPQTAQQSIPFDRMFPDGICRVGLDYYTKTVQFQDINYQLAQQEDKTEIFEEWCAFLNFFDSSVKFQLSFENMATDVSDFEKSIKISHKNDGFDDVRDEYSEVLLHQMEAGNNGLTKTKYLTFGINAESMKTAKPRLIHIETDILNNFKRLGVQAKSLNGSERLELMHRQFHIGDDAKFHFDWKYLTGSGLSVKDFIAPSSFAFPTGRYFQIGDMYGCMSFLSIDASDISDRLLADFLSMESSQIVTMHIQSVDQNEAIKTIKHTITELDRSKIEEQKKAVRAGYDMDIIPSDLATYGKDAKALLKELQSQNERMFLLTFLSSLKLTNNLEDIELEGFRVAENTAVKEEKKTVTLTVAECSEFHNMGEFHENITSVAEAVAKFKEIPPERMHGIPAIGIRVADLKNPEDSVEMDVLIGKRIDLDMLRYVPDIAENWQAQQMIAALIHDMPEAQIEGEIPENIQKKIDWIESRDKRADELHQITDKLEKGVKDVFQSDKYKQFLNVMAKFPRYSVNNTMLIMMQRPDAQLCQSFTGWKQMGRYVKKGEKGISILAPAPYKIEREQTKLDEKGRPVFDADGEPVKEKVEVTIRAFKVVKTFDLSQTDGKELPTIGPSELVGNIEGYPKLLQALQEISPVPVSFELIDGDAKGFYHLEDKKIVVQDGMSEVQTIKTLLHEMAHEKLHDKDNVPEAKDISRNGKEVEAESVAYVVCQHYGINTSDYSFSYVAGWSEGKETPELKASLDKIRQTASEFIYQIDQKMEVLMADKDQVQESAKTSSPFAQELMDKITEGAKDLGFIPVVSETQEKTANPELKVVVDKALKDLDKKRTLSKVKESVKSKLKANTEKAEQAPKKSRTTKAKEERA